MVASAIIVSTLRIPVLAGVVIAAGLVFLMVSRDEPPPKEEPRPLLWSVAAEDLEMIAISLPLQERSEVWFVGNDKRWHFDEPGGAGVNPERWGDGIALLLDNPAAERLIAGDATSEQLGIFGLAAPQMEITLGARNADPLRAEVGDATPDGQAYYVRVGGGTEVYSIHHSWFDVLKRLVLEPPHRETPS